MSSRPEITARQYRTLMYLEVDRVPDVEFYFWPQTIRRWSGEGMPIECATADPSDLPYREVHEHFDIDEAGCGGFGLRVNMNPVFEEKTIDRRGDVVTRQDATGAIAECYMDDTENSSIPHFIKFPVETHDDWRAMKERYRLDEPARAIGEEDLAGVRKAVADGLMILTSANGPYGAIRGWMGFESLSVAFYESPEMIHDMVEHWTALCVHQLNSLPPDIPIDFFGWWEDMAGKNGPFVSPEMFREFLQPCYSRVMAAARERGCVLGSVDCDGNPHDIVANWLEEGVNLVYPMEVAAGGDPYEWRREFGTELRLQGGIDKRALAAGRSAIDAELERIKPLLDQGGYIPHVDHAVPPDVSYSNYCYYREKKRKLIGK